jgi:cob(I)alamin adenosyltransferase
MNDMNKEKETGLLVVYTGNGKGKTTAAIGLCVRACGYDLKVAIVQFIKGSWFSGEINGIKRLAPNVEFFRTGKGFVNIIDDNLPITEHEKAAGEGLEFARELMLSGKYDIIVLDELNVAVQLGLLKIDDVLKFLDERPAGLDMIITGRDAHQRLIEKADLVTEMKEIKHPFQKGKVAKRGIDY